MRRVLLLLLALGCGGGRPIAKGRIERPHIRAALAAGDTTVLFAENFESGYAQGWTGLAGTWAVHQDAGNFVYTNTANVTVAGGGANLNDNWAVYGPTTWTDYAVEVRVKPLSFPGTAGIVRIFARWQNPSNWYYETLTKDGHVQLRRYRNGAILDLAPQKVYPVALGQWYTLRLECLGSSLKAYVNGVLQLSATDTLFKAGPMAVGGWNDFAEFDDVRVLALTGAASPPPPPPPPAVPGTVTTLTATPTADTSVTLAFTEVTDGTGSPASYDVRYSTTPIVWGSAAAVTMGTCATPLAGRAIGTRLTCTALGLTASTGYGFQVVAFRGTLNINAVFGALSNVATATTLAPVPPPPPPTAVAYILMSPQAVTIPVGASVQLHATAYANPPPAVVVTPITWTSLAPSVATVDTVGLAIGRSPGTATIQTSVGQVVARVPLTVTPAPFDRVYAKVLTAPGRFVVARTDSGVLVQVDSAGARRAGYLVRFTTAGAYSAGMRQLAADVAAGLADSARHLGTANPFATIDVRCQATCWATVGSWTSGPVGPAVLRGVANAIDAAARGDSVFAPTDSLPYLRVVP